MELDSDRLKWNGLVIGLGAALGAIAERALAAQWRKARGRKPPDPADRSRSFGEAVLWRMAVGALGGTATALTRRLASVGWEHFTGAPPPGIRGEVDTSVSSTVV